jgi:hypothetical protein
MVLLVTLELQVVPVQVPLLLLAVEPEAVEEVQ